MKKKGFTLIELLVVIAIIAMLLAILMPALNKVKKIAQRVVCATNLKGLGTALIVYANDYEDDFVVQGDGFDHTWAYQTAGWQATTSPWLNSGNITVGASLYLLVREADVSPKSFTCAGGSQNEFEGENVNELDLVELWDFGGENFGDTPRKCVSYAYHMPYADNGREGRFAADGSRSASFAVMADKNPWMDPKLKLPDGDLTAETWFDYVRRMARYYSDDTITESDWRVKSANTQPHGREGQNVLFGDGHASYEKTTDVGVKHDGIYTIQGGGGTIEDTIRQGVGAAITIADGFGAGQPISGDDSFLINDDDRAAP